MATNGVLAATSGNTKIGCEASPWDGKLNNLNGLLNDLRVYNRALSAAEIKALCAEPVKAFETPFSKLTPQEREKLEAEAQQRWASINVQSALTSRKWDAARKAVEVFTEKYGETAFAAKRADDFKNVLSRCAEGRLSEGLAGYWKFDEGNGEVTADSSGNGNNGKIARAEWIQGHSGAALSFNGKDDFVAVPNSSSLQVTGSLTLSLWFKYGGKAGDWSRLASKGWNGNAVPWVAYDIQ